MAETVVMLKPRDQWRKGLTWQGLIKEMGFVFEREETGAKANYSGNPKSMLQYE